MPGQHEYYKDLNDSSGDRTPEETHALFPQNDTTDQKTYDPWTTKHLAEFDGLMKQGTGLAVFHYTTHVVNETAQKYFMDWIGGYYKSGFSKVVMGTWTTAVASTDHPVVRGVQPWTYTEEIFTNEVLPEDSRRTMLLTGKSDAGVTSPYRGLSSATAVAAALLWPGRTYIRSARGKQSPPPGEWNSVGCACRHPPRRRAMRSQ